MKQIDIERTNQKLAKQIIKALRVLVGDKLVDEGLARVAPRLPPKPRVSKRAGLELSELNKKEQRVVHVLARADGSRQVNQLGAAFSATAKNRAQAVSWARNAVRRPMREGFIRRIGDSGTGAYRVTAKGAKAVAK